MGNGRLQRRRNYQSHYEVVDCPNVRHTCRRFSFVVSPKTGVTNPTRPATVYKWLAVPVNPKIRRTAERRLPKAASYGTSAVQSGERERPSPGTLT